MTAKIERRRPPTAVKGSRLAVRVRAAGAEDEGALTVLRRQAEQVHARLLPDYFRVSTMRDLSAPVTGGPGGANVVILVAEAGGANPVSAGRTIVGYVSIKVVETPRDPALTPRRRAHVETIVVNEGHRKAGIGTALMRAAAAWARRREATELVLTVWSDNAAAEALYGRLGYQPIARILRRPLDP